MPAMIKLHLGETESTLKHVQALPGLAGLELDTDFGLVAIDPKKSLFVVRVVDSIDKVEKRQKLSPEIIGAYGDIRISNT